MSLAFCESCGNPARLPQAHCVPVYATAFACDPDTVWYCSPACEVQDDRACAPELCAACQRAIRLRRDDLGVDDPRTAQFTMDADGHPVCRRCAGVAPESPLPLNGAFDLRSHEG